MGTIADALTWSGSGATLSMFVVTGATSPPELGSSPRFAPLETTTFVMCDDGNVLSGRGVFEYDFVFVELPSNLDVVLTDCLRAALVAGAELAWFELEGSFSFEHLLTEEVADQIYAVADLEGVSLASDATRLSRAWRDRVVRAGTRLRADAASRLASDREP